MAKGDRNRQLRVMALTAKAEAERTAQAVAIVEKWNGELASGKPPLFSPTLEAAFRAKRPWLNLYCSGCDQIHEIDLRRIVRPKDFAIMGLRAALKCETCRGGPEPTLLGLESFAFEVRRLHSDEEAQR